MLRIFPLRLWSPRQQCIPKSKSPLITELVSAGASLGLLVIRIASLALILSPVLVVQFDLVEVCLAALGTSKTSGTVKVQLANDQRIGLDLPSLYNAKAYSLRGKTASGREVRRGVIAADPLILPLGTRVRLEAGDWSGEYLVSDTKGDPSGKRLSLPKAKQIDIWTPSEAEAKQFGERAINLTVLSYGTDRSPVALREALEKKRRDKTLTRSLYDVALAAWEMVTKHEIQHSAEYYAKRPALYDSAKYNPIKYGPEDLKKSPLWTPITNAFV